MKAKVIATPKNPTIIDGKTVKVGDTVDVGESTFRNLAKNGVLEAADSESKAVDLGIPSTLTVPEAKEQISEREQAREDKKEADEAKKHHK